MLAEWHEQVAGTETTLAAVNDEIERLQGERISERDVNAAFADFDNVWNALSALEKWQVLTLIVARVEYDATDSSLTPLQSA